jgi:DegV family protein with EDD domain
MLSYVVLKTTYVFLQKGYLLMSYRILCDSCTDFTSELRSDTHFEIIPLTLHVGKYDIVDDLTFDQSDFLQKVSATSECARSSCPTPLVFYSHFCEADDIYIVTLSSHLSGSYNSGELAKKMYLEENPHKNIHVFDSKSASVGQTLIAICINNLASKNLPFDEVVRQTEAYIEEQSTKFVLETLENLRKNGRLSHLTYTIANVLNIKPVMTSTPQGEIDKLTQAHGMKKAIQKMAAAIAEDAINSKDKILGIAHCGNRARAEFACQEILKLIPFKSVYITNTAGVSSLYAAKGGIIICY